MLQLKPGANTVHLSATDAAGTQASLEETLKFRAESAAWLNDETGAPVAGVQLALVGTDGTVAAFRADPEDGSYAIDSTRCRSPER